MNKVKKYTIQQARTGNIIATDVIDARSFMDRLIGLMFKKVEKCQTGILLTPCNSIHTCFMRFSLDVVFLDKKNRVVKTIYNIPPWRITPLFWRAYKVLELPTGKIGRSLLQEGDELEIISM